MSVEITFETDDCHGLVAVGTSLWEAARRLGLSLPADCKGCGECDTCAVVIMRGAELLSPANEFELKILGAERLGGATRLACQTKLNKMGEVVVRQAPIVGTASKKTESGKAFRDLPLKQQVGVFIEQQANAIFEGVNTLRGRSNALIEKFLNLKPQKAASTHPSDRDSPSTNK